MLRIYYSNFALSTWCVRVSLRLCDTVRVFTRSRSQPVDSRERPPPWPLHFSPSIRYRDTVARLMTENVRVTGYTWRVNRIIVRRYAGVRRRFGSTCRMR